MDDGKLDTLEIERFLGMSKTIKSTPTPLLATPLEARVQLNLCCITKNTIKTAIQHWDLNFTSGAIKFAIRGGVPYGGRPGGPSIPWRKPYAP
jgi:hypothetical protein